MTKRKVDLLILDSKETITVDDTTNQDELGIIDNGGVAVSGGKIIEAASSQLLEQKFRSQNVLHAYNEIILPGFVDPHSHLVFNGSREEEFQLRIQGLPYLEALRKGGGILETVNKTRQASEGELYAMGQNRVNKAMELGTTTLEVKSGYGLRPYDELKILRVVRRLAARNPCRLVSTFLGAHAIPPERTLEEYSKMVVDEMLPAVRDGGLAEFCDVFCESGVFTPEQSMRILRAAASMGLRPKIHADQFTNNGGAQIANRVRATSADHLVHSHIDDLERMIETSVTPVVLPASSHSLLGDARAPAREMLSRGLPLALGSDFSPSNWILGQLTVAALAARDLRMRAGEIIRGITINAAKALGRHHEVGSIKPGKSADFVIVKAPSHKWIGYTYGEGIVDKVLIGGRIVVNEGRRVS